MITRTIALATTLSLGVTVAGAARADLTAADAITADMVPAVAACMSAATAAADAIACLDRDGISDGARAFASALADQSALGVPGILVEVTELGPLDVAQAILPALSTEERHPVFVNGVRDTALALELAFAPAPPDTAGTRAIRASHPQAAEASRVSVAAHRVMPGGAQRFVLVDRVTDGCPTCEEVGAALTYLDFLRGALVGVDRLGWFPPLSSPETIAERLEAADIRVVQARLNLLGYDAGPVDGVVGRRTRGAFYQLKRDHCLPEDPTIRPVIPILSASGPGLAPPSCAPGIFSRPPSAAEPVLTTE